VFQVPRRCGLRRLPAYWPTMRLDREVVTTLRGRCAGVGPPVVPRWRPYPAQRGVGCGRSAAAVCQQRSPLGTDSALTSENSGGRDRV